LRGKVEMGGAGTTARQWRDPERGDPYFSSLRKKKGEERTRRFPRTEKRSQGKKLKHGSENRGSVGLLPKSGSKRNQNKHKHPTKKKKTKKPNKPKTPTNPQKKKNITGRVGLIRGKLTVERSLGKPNQEKKRKLS